MLPLQLRPAADADTGFLLRLYAATRRQALASAGWPDAVLRDFLHFQFTLRSTQYHAAFPSAEDHIVLVDGAAAGRMLVDRAFRAWRVVDIALLPQHQGRGIGTALLQMLQREAAEAGCALDLQVDATNPAQRLYRRLGFEARSGDGVYRPMRWHPHPRREADPVEVMPMESLS